MKKLLSDFMSMVFGEKEYSSTEIFCFCLLFPVLLLIAWYAANL